MKNQPSINRSDMNKIRQIYPALQVVSSSQISLKRSNRKSPSRMVEAIKPDIQMTISIMRKNIINMLTIAIPILIQIWAMMIGKEIYFMRVAR